jgi:hypothetical protein
MPAIPATGTTWDGAGFSLEDPRFLERGKLRALLIRDARGSSTNISPHTSAGAINWSPFATDGKWRGDLMAFVQTNGIWEANPSANEGFHLAGAFREGNGPQRKPSIKKDDFMIVQSNFPFDTDIVEEGEPFSFTAVETAKPLIRRLRYNLPLNAANGTALVEIPGGTNAGWSRPLDGDDVERQVLLVSEFKKGGLPVYTVDGYSLAKMVDIGNSKKDKKDSEAAELTYQPLPDGYFMAVVDGVYRPILTHTWVGGTGWMAIGSATISFLVTLGTQSTGTFTLTFGGQTTATIAFGATNAQVKTALVALDDGFSASDWTVAGSAGGPFTVTTPGARFGALTGSGAALGTPGTFVITPV